LPQPWADWLMGMSHFEERENGAQVANDAMCVSEGAGSKSASRFMPRTGFAQEENAYLCLMWLGHHLRLIYPLKIGIVI